MEKIRFIDENGSFACDNPDEISGLYFPIAGEYGIKSALTPNLGGDSKVDQNHFLLEPVSVMDLHNNRSSRNFWCVMEDKTLWSATGSSAKQQADKFTDKKENMQMQGGFMWHQVCRSSNSPSFQASITSFVPMGHNVEVMQVALKNIGDEALTFTPVAAIPLYGRSADNIRDHRHVTSLLTRITVVEKGVVVDPTLSFDERGHQKNDTVYYVLGHDENGVAPVEFFPEIDDFVGEGGNLENPESLARGRKGVAPGTVINGKEPLGGLVFETITLQPQEEKEYTIFLGICNDKQECNNILEEYDSKDMIYHEFARVKQYWRTKINVSYHTADKRFDMFMKWVSFQPELRRIYGCSFLPHHDYGKGGRGWRDLWQDCLALLLMNPEGVRELLYSNFAGIRVDGSNATIIGEKQGEFKADRNAITRVWMDHGVWPFMTTLLYMNQTGDREFLYEKSPYFKDRQVMRGKAVDGKWDGKSTCQMDVKGRVYKGTVLEHLLLQNLCAFWEVGEHNISLLRDADWNDALDMANSRGESVAFMNAYGKNLIDLAELLQNEYAKGQTSVDLLAELEPLLCSDAGIYEDVDKKTEILKKYMESCTHTISGKRMEADTQELAHNLMEKGQWILNHIRQKEWVTDEDGNGWFNGYYDNSGNRVEGIVNDTVRMMLTSQVFSIMAGTATKEQIEAIVQSADKYLYDKDCGGYRLNTNFNEIKTDMGRMFGFAFGEKENGAVFSHMAVMYANALYTRGFAKECYKSLESLYNQSMNFEKSKIYPGIPEYFGAGGRGLYHYLTGAASWYMLTVITQMFGVRGEKGMMVLEPKLLAKQFTEEGTAGLELSCMGHSWSVRYDNPQGLEYKSYRIQSVKLDDKDITPQLCMQGESVALPATLLDTLDARIRHKLTILLG